MIDYLKNLVGLEIKNVNEGIVNYYAIKKDRSTPDQESQLLISITLYFNDDYRLSIYNKFEVLNFKGKKFQDLIGLILIDTSEENNKAKLFLDNGATIIVDLSPDGFIGPEAMLLLGPNGLGIVYD